jgi:ParB family chromosome partitioning protein
MALTKKGLGRGFDSLLPQNFDESLLLGAADKIEKIAVDKLTPNQHQPRKEFSEESLRELADSIKEYGILQPVIVTPHDNGYMLIAGERRWRASKLADQKTVPAIVRSMKELERLEIALIENVQRVDLSPLEQAESIEYLHTQFGTSYTEIAKRLGKAGSTVNNIVRLMQLPDNAKEALRNGTISEGHARAVLALKGDAEHQEALLKHIVKQGWTVRQAEQFAVSVKQGHKEAPNTRTKAPERMRTETPVTKRLSKKLSAPVFIRRTAKGGKLEVVFKSDEELQSILKVLAKS